MKSHRSIAWSGFTAISALLCVATCVLWIRSYWYVSYWDSDRYWISDGHGHMKLDMALSWRGGLCYRHLVLWASNPSIIGAPSQHGKRFDRSGLKWPYHAASNGLVNRTYAGFGFLNSDRVDGNVGNVNLTQSDWRIALPYWFAAAIFALLPVGRLWVFRRAWRLRHTRCFYCGYDLRAMLDRCPECGAVPPEKVKRLR